jgi:transketolase N-terminal domain/subunit
MRKVRAVPKRGIRTMTGRKLPAIEPIVDKLTSFGLRTRRIDGNSVAELMDALRWARESEDRPAAHADLG